MSATTLTLFCLLGQAADPPPPELRFVSSDCPVIYDNDWWVDVPDAAYVMSMASAGRCDLKGCVVSRDMWEWKSGYKFSLKDCRDEADRLYEACLASGLRADRIPRPVAGAAAALREPDGGRFEDTAAAPTDGSRLIVRAARAATPERPLLVFCGGPCTTLANAWLEDPSITDRVVAFQVDGGAYNGKDEWSWRIVERHFRFVNGFRGYFWPDLAEWDPEIFDGLPDNSLAGLMREYARGGLAKSNQFGDGLLLYDLFEPRVVTRLELTGPRSWTVPKDACNVTAMRREVVRGLRSAMPDR